MTAPTVTLLGTWPPIPGISAYCFQLADALSKIAPLEVLTFSKLYPDFLYPGGPVPIDETFPQTPSAVGRVRRSLAWYNPFGWFWAGLTTKSDILHVQFWSVPAAPMLLSVMAFARVRGVTCVLTVHNLSEHERRRGFRFALSCAMRLSHRILLHQPDSPAWFREACKRATGHPPVTIPHGVLDLYAGQAPVSPTAREVLRIPPEAWTILFFGSIRPYKGLDVLLDAFDVVASQSSEVHLVIAGRPWEPWEPYQAKIDAAPWRDRVHLRLNYIPTSEVRTFFEVADLVVLPYRGFEAQSGVAMTAVGFGKPLLVTRVGALPTLQPDDEFVVPPNDAGALASAIRQAFSDSARLSQLQESARQIAKSHDWDDVARQTLELYRDALSDRSKTT